MDVAQGTYGLQAMPAAKRIVFKIFLVYFFRGATLFLLIYMNQVYLLGSRYRAMQDSHHREKYNKEGKMEKSK